MPTTMSDGCQLSCSACGGGSGGCCSVGGAVHFHSGRDGPGTGAVEESAVGCVSADSGCSACAGGRGPSARTGPASDPPTPGRGLRNTFLFDRVTAGRASELCCGGA